MPVGPTRSRPGPTLFMQERTALKFVMVLLLSSEISRKETALMIKLASIKTQTPLMMRLSSTLPFIITLRTERGCSIRLTSLAVALMPITKRATLIPPPVEPADAPTTISSSSMPRESSGQLLKSAVVYPEVDMIDATVNDAWWSDSPKEAYWGSIVSVMSATEARRIPRWARSSSSKRIARNSRMSNRKYTLKLMLKSTIKTVTTLWQYGLKAAMPAFRMPKPPVPAVPNIVQKLSNTLMPPSSSKTTCTALSAT